MSYELIAGEQAYSEWSTGFRNSRKGMAAIKALEALYQNSPQKTCELFKELVLRACFYTKTFKTNGDLNREKRDLLRDLSSRSDGFTEELDSVTSQLDFFRSIYETLLLEGASEVYQIPATKLKTRTPKISVDALIEQLDLYSAGIKRLQERFDIHDFREECWVYGNMRFPERIDKANQYKKHNPATCLMFELAIYFRLWTATNGQKLFGTKDKLIITEGLAIPKTGRRHDKIIALFVNASLDETVDEATTRARLEKLNKKITLAPWKAENFDVMMFPESIVKAL